MKAFEIPQMEVIRFGRVDMMTTSPGCDCVDCTPCEYGNHCEYYDTCRTYCGKDANCVVNNPT